MIDLRDSQSVATEGRRSGRRRFAASLGFRNVSAVYILIVVFIVFALWIPSKFLHPGTVSQVANENAVSLLLALSLIIPLTAGVFDLSVAYTLGVANVFVSYLLGHGGVPLPLILIFGVLIGVAIGAVNAFIVVVLRIDSFIATLATGSLLLALILVISNDEQQTAGMTNSFLNIARHTEWGVSLPVFYVLVIAVVMWYFLEHRAIGRELRAVGLAPEAARLVGIRLGLLRSGSLLVSGGLAAAAGVLVTATVGGGSPDIGPPYLIPAFTGAFLGATQLKSGLFNVWGTVLAVALLGTVSVGLALAGAAIWVPYVVTGIVLIAALGLTVYERKRAV
jgi:ribose transport system permease protein